MCVSVFSNFSLLLKLFVCLLPYRLTTTGLTEGVTRVNQHNKDSSKNKDHLEVKVYEDEEEVNLLNTQESSHAFD